MKKSHIILCTIVICLLLGIIAMLILLLLSDNNSAGQNGDSAKTSDITTSAVTTATVATSRTVDPNSFEYWVSQQMLSTAITPTTTTTKKSAEDITTKRSWFTAYTGSVTVLETTTTTAEPFTTTAAPKTTRTLTQTEKEMVYNLAYNQLMMEYYSELREQQNLQNQIANLERERNAARAEVSERYAQFQQEIKKLNERYAAMGMYNSGAHKAAVESLQRDYQNATAAANELIDAYDDQIEALKAVQKPVKEPTEEEIWQLYLVKLEEYQQKMLS